MTDPAPLLRLFHEVLERHLPPEEVKEASLALLLVLDQAPIPSPAEIDRTRRDMRVLELLRNHVSVEIVALRLNLDRSTVYRAYERALTIKRVA